MTAREGRSATRPTATDVTREELLARSRSLAPALRARAAESERLRRAPDETVAEMKRLGLFRIMQPARYGGFALGWDVFCESVQILAAGCGAQAWVLRVLGDHAQLLGAFPVEAQEDVWAGDPEALCCAAFPPVGLARRTASGFVYSGRHSYASGIDHVQWAICGGRIEGEPAPHFFLLPKSDVTVIDDWHVNGLEGSGSKSFEAREVAVPAHRVLSFADAIAATGPGTKLNPAPVARLPRGGYTTSAFAAVLVGMAEGLLADWLDLTVSRRSSGVAVAARESTQIVAGEAGAEIETAGTLYLATIRNVMRRLEEGEVLPAHEAVHARRNVAFACRLAVGAANRLYAATGGRAVYRGNPFERQFRNILAGAQHVALDWSQSAGAYGAHLLRSHGADIGTAATLPL